MSRLPLRAPVVIAVSAVVVLACIGAYFQGLRSSDGANYAVVARSLAEGRGLWSLVIQPGLVGVVPTSTSGQAWVIQAPLWPILLAGAFRLFGSTEGVFIGLSGVLFALVLYQTWRLGQLMSGTATGAWLAWAFAALNPFLIGSSIAGTAALLQASLVSATLIRTVTGRLTLAGALEVGAILGLACVARENSIFVLAAIVIIWMERLRETGLAGTRLVLRISTLVTIAVCTVAIPVALEAWRKASVIGSFDAPVLRLTFLYYTSVADQGWYFIYDHPMLKINPVRYFLERPGELLSKMWFQLSVSFGRETLTALMSFVPWFLPVVSPAHLRAGIPRALAKGLLATLGLQVILGSMSYLNFTYFFAFLPALSAAVASTLLGFREAFRSSAHRRLGHGLLLAGALYGAAPLLVNAVSLATGRRPGTGDYEITRADERALSQFVAGHVPPGKVLSASHSALLAWNTRRTVFQYSGHPTYTVSDSPMWRALDLKIHIDYILLNTLAYEERRRTLLPGFEEVARLRQGELRAWLFTRDETELSRLRRPGREKP